MNYSQYRFTLDLQKHQSQMSIAVFKHDTAVRLFISLTDGGKPYYIKDGNTAIFYGMRADQKELVHRCMIKNNTEIIYEFDKGGSTTFVEGIIQCQLRLYGTEGELITAPRFVIVVDERLVNDQDIEIPEGSPISALDEIFANEKSRQEVFENVKSHLGWDYVITSSEELTTANLATMSGNVRVKGVEAHDVSITIPDTINLIQFTDCNVSGNIVGTKSTKIVGLDANNDVLTLHGFGCVEECNGLIELHYCTYVKRCEIIHAFRCKFLDTITARCLPTYIPTVDFVFYECKLISRVEYYGSGNAETKGFYKCDHIASVNNAEPNYPIRYIDCTDVVGDSCDNYYTEEDAGKVSIITADGTKKAEKIQTWDHFITRVEDFTTKNLENMSGTVLVRDITHTYPSSSTSLYGKIVTVPSLVTKIEFLDCDISNFVLGCSYGTRVVGLKNTGKRSAILGAGKVTGCEGNVQIDRSDNVQDCELYIPDGVSDEELNFEHCKYVRDIRFARNNNINFTNCDYMSNIFPPYSGEVNIIYDNCNNVDEWTCYGYAKGDNANKVQAMTTDGKKSLIPVYSQSETDAKIEEFLAQLIDSAPETLNTLDELAKALGSDPNFATTVATALGNRYTKEEIDGFIQDINFDMGGRIGYTEEIIGILSNQMGDISTILTALHEGGIS